MLRAASLLSVLSLAACAEALEPGSNESESTPATSSSITTDVSVPMSPTALPAPEDPLLRDLSRATSFAEAVDVLQGYFGDESVQTAFAVRTIQSPPGAGLLEDWMSRHEVTDAELWAPPARAPAGLGSMHKGTRTCVRVARHTRADPAEPYALMATAVGETDGDKDAVFYLRVVGSLPARLPAHFCGVYTGLSIGNDGSAPKIVGRFVPPRPGLTPHHP